MTRLIRKYSAVLVKSRMEEEEIRRQLENVGFEVK